MKKAKIAVGNIPAGILEEIKKNNRYRFDYFDNYHGTPVSLTMPLTEKVYLFDTFPPFFDGLLPEGLQLEGLLKSSKIDRYDYMSQLIAVGKDTVGNVTIEETT